MKHLTYVGPVDKVTVYLPSGRSIDVTRGETVDLLASEAAVLTDNPDWATPQEPDQEAQQWEFSTQQS